MFAHDTLHNPKRTQCANNPEEFIALCCPGKCTCKRSCIQYVNGALKRISGMPSIEQLDFIGLQEEMPLAVCLFLYTFQVNQLFEHECLRTSFNPFPQVKVNTHDQQAVLNPGRSEGTRVYASKVEPDKCGKTCKTANYEDYLLWKSSAEAFWDRFLKLAWEIDLQFSC
jgi:hypothetical protein